MAKVVVEALDASNLIRTPMNNLRVMAAQGLDGTVYCHLRGANRREKSIFLQALQESLNPVENPRYLLKGFSGTLYRERNVVYYAVPKILGVKKELAAAFHEEWTRRVYATHLVFTRNSNGRLELLKARTKSRAKLQDAKAQRVTRWR